MVYHVIVRRTSRLWPLRLWPHVVSWINYYYYYYYHYYDYYYCYKQISTSDSTGFEASCGYSCSGYNLLVLWIIPSKHNNQTPEDEVATSLRPPEFNLESTTPDGPRWGVFPFVECLNLCACCDSGFDICLYSYRMICFLCLTNVELIRGNATQHHSIVWYTPSPPTKSLGFGGFDSSRLLILRGGNSMSVEFYRGSPGKLDSRTLSRETRSRWTGCTYDALRKTHCDIMQYLDTAGGICSTSITEYYLS